MGKEKEKNISGTERMDRVGAANWQERERKVNGADRN